MNAALLGSLNTNKHLSLALNNEISQRNKHISPIVSHIQDYGPAVKKKEKPAPAMQETMQDEFVRRNFDQKTPNNQGNNPVDPITREDSIPVVNQIVGHTTQQSHKRSFSFLSLAITALAFAGVFFYVNTLKIELSNLQAQINVMEGKMEVLLDK